MIAALVAQARRTRQRDRRRGADRQRGRAGDGGAVDRRRRDGGGARAEEPAVRADPFARCSASTSIRKPSRRTRVRLREARRAGSRDRRGSCGGATAASCTATGVVAPGPAAQPAHVEVELRPPYALVQRGALIVMLDLALVGAALARERRRRRRRGALAARAPAHVGTQLSRATVARAVRLLRRSGERVRDLVVRQARDGRDAVARAAGQRDAARDLGAAAADALAAAPRATASTRRCSCIVGGELRRGERSAVRRARADRPLPARADVELALDVARRGDRHADSSASTGASALFGYRAFNAPAIAVDGHRRAGARRRARARPPAPRPRRARAVRDGGRRARRAVAERHRGAPARAADRHAARSGAVDRRRRARACRSRPSRRSSSVRCSPRSADGGRSQREPHRARGGAASNGGRAAQRRERRGRRRSGRPRRRSPIRAPRRCSACALAAGTRRSRRARRAPIADAVERFLSRATRRGGVRAVARAAAAARHAHAAVARRRRGDLDDVTELARAQRVLAWGEMARQVAHEIKNPLTPIRLGVQHLRRARADSASTSIACSSRTSIRSSPRSTGSTRSRARSAATARRRKSGPPPAPVDVAAIVREVVSLERMGERDAISSGTSSGADVPVYALARADELKEVLLNVLENARLAQARRRVTVRRRTSRTARVEHRRAGRRARHPRRRAAADLRAALLDAHERQRARARDQPPARRRLGRRDHRRERARERRRRSRDASRYSRAALQS